MKIFRMFNLALQFTTRIPGWQINNYSEKELGESGVLFPVIGFFVGAILFAEVKLLSHTNIITTALIIVVSEILLSGGLHLDGFMDTMDGLLSGSEGEKMLTIMSDSNVGAHSVSMLAALLLSKTAFLIYLIPLNPGLVVLLPFIGRLLMLLCIIIFPYPKKSGIGIIYKSHLKKGFVYFIAALALAGVALYNIYALFSLLLTFLTILYFAKKITSKIGGLTGDAYGAIEEITEGLFLFYILVIYIIVGR